MCVLTPDRLPLNGEWYYSLRGPVIKPFGAQFIDRERFPFFTGNSFRQLGGQDQFVTKNDGSVTYTMDGKYSQSRTP